MSRPPLALLLVSADFARLRAALTLARVEVALGGTAHLFLQGEAAALLRPPIRDTRDDEWLSVGDPSLATLVDETLDDGVRISVCQTGLALAKLDAAAIEPRIEQTGPVAFLADAAETTRLLTF
jgi:predicted peroxiredoxin